MSKWVKWSNFCFSKYFIIYEALYWFDYTLCKWIDSCICWNTFSWCCLMVTLDTLKKTSSTICLLPVTSWLGRNYFSEPVPFGDSILWEYFRFLLISCVFQELNTNKYRVCCDFFSLANKDENILPLSLNLKRIRYFPT